MPVTAATAEPGLQRFNLRRVNLVSRGGNPFELSRIASQPPDQRGGQRVHTSPGGEPIFPVLALDYPHRLRPGFDDG